MVNVRRQIGRFAVVGILNTVIDYGLFNILLLVTGIRHGIEVGLLNMLCVALASVNSFYFNRSWTFQANHYEYRRQIFKFVIATAVGILINSAVVTLTSSLVNRMPISAFIILNGGKLLAAVFSISWNFITYRGWVFKQGKVISFTEQWTPGLVSLIIPAYNEAGRLPDRLRNLAETLPKLFPVEILVVDDGSTDNTGDIARNLAEQYECIRCISYRPNRGKGKAVQTGVQKAAGEFVIFTDADNTFTIDHIKMMVNRLMDGESVVIGTRRTEFNQRIAGKSTLRLIFSNGFNLLIRALLLPGIYDTQCGLKGFHRQEAFEIFSRQRVRGFAFDVELLTLAKDLNLEITKLPVVVDSCAGSTVNPFFSPLQMGWDIFKLKMSLLTNGYNLPRERTWMGGELISAIIFILALIVRIPWLWLVPRYVDELKEVNLGYLIYLGQALPLHNIAHDIGSMHNYILGGLFRLFGPSIYLPRLYVAVLSALTVVLVYILGRKLFGQWVGLVAAGLLLTNGMDILVTHMAWANSTTPFFFLLAMVATINAEQRKSGRWLVFASFTWALALQTHSSVIIYILVAFLYVVRPTFRKNTGISDKWYFTAALAFITGYANMIYYNLTSYGGSIRWLTHKGYAMEGHPGLTSYFNNLEQMLVELFRSVSSTYASFQHVWHYLTQPVFISMILLWIVGSYCAVKQKKALPLWMMIGAFAVIPWINHRYVFFVATRYIMPVIICALLLAALGCVQLFTGLSAKFSSDKVVYVPAGLILLALMIWQVTPFYTYCRSLEKTNQSNYMAMSVISDIQRESKGHDWDI